MDGTRGDFIRGAGALATSGFTFGRPLFGQRIARPSKTPIQHVIVACQENHSFDHYFGYAPFAGRYGVPRGYSQPSTFGPDAVPKYPHRFKSYITADPTHEWGAIHREWQRGKMDGFYVTNGETALGYYDGSDLPFYYSLFQTSTLCANYFCSVLGPTYPNRLYLYAGTSGGNTTNTINPGDLTYPCILDLLDLYGVTFKCYNLGETCCFSGNNALVFFKKYQHDKRVVGFTKDDYLADVQRGTLPQVSFIMSADEHAEHPGYDIQEGIKAQYQLIRALQSSRLWANSAYFLTWDEGGGFFDHVRPPLFDAYGPGIRVPMLVISPYVKKANLETTLYEHTSVLKFIEYIFALPTMASINHRFDTSTPGANNDAAHGKPTGPPAPPRDRLKVTGDMRECFNGI